MMVSLARNGDRGAFAELVRRRQSSIRSLMRRSCNDATLADDLAQQVFLQVWQKIRTLKHADAFGGWLKRVAISVWLLHQRKKDPLHGALELETELAETELTETELVQHESTGAGMDLDRALATLSDTGRLCVVLSYQQGMSHAEIADVMELPLGTVKSQILRATTRLRQMLSAYRDKS